MIVAGSQSDVFGFENDHLQKKSDHIGRDRLPISEAPATGSTADASPLRKSSSDVLDRTRVMCPVDLGL